MKEVRKWDGAALDHVRAIEGPLLLLLLRDMCLIAADDGRAPLATLATRFRNFFHKRTQEGKVEMDAETAARLRAVGKLGAQSIEWWSVAISECVLEQRGPAWLSRDGNAVVWNQDLWASWSAGFRKALRNAAETRLIEYFEKHIEGGW